MRDYRFWTHQEFVELVDNQLYWDAFEPEVYEYFLDKVGLELYDYKDPDEMWEDYLSALDEMEDEEFPPDDEYEKLDLIILARTEELMLVYDYFDVYVVDFDNSEHRNILDYKPFEYYELPVEITNAYEDFTKEW